MFLNIIYLAKFFFSFSTQNYLAVGHFRNVIFIDVEVIEGGLFNLKDLGDIYQDSLTACQLSDSDIWGKKKSYTALKFSFVL